MEVRQLDYDVLQSLVQRYQSGATTYECADWLGEKGFEVTAKQLKDYFYKRGIRKLFMKPDLPKMEYMYLNPHVEVATPVVEADRIVICSDHQARYDDKLTGQAFVKFLSDFSPEAIIVNGDLFDFEALSKYPTRLENRITVSADVQAGRAILESYRKACPDAAIYLIAGNHEQRLEKYILNQAPELSGVPSLEIANFLGLNDFGVAYVGPHGAGVDWKGVLIYHGSRVSSHSAYTAKAEFFDAGTSLVHGHTQRLGAYYLTDRAGTHAAYEGGCMCRIDPDGAPPSMRGPRQNNWQQGFMVGYSANDIWNLYAVSITGHKFIWNGRLYKP